MSPRRFLNSGILWIAVFLAFLSQASAQFDTNGPNAALIVQGVSAGVVDPIAHNVPVELPGALQIRVTSGTNLAMGLIVLASTADPTGAVFTTPLWGGSIDIGSFAAGPASISIFADGIGLSVNPAVDVYYRTAATTNVSNPVPAFSQGIAFPTTAACGFRIAMQCVVQDPTNGPIGIDNTEAADLNFVAASRQTLFPTSDGFVIVPFRPGHTFPFHGANYGGVFVHENGFVTFTPNLSSFTGQFIDPATWVGAARSIAAYPIDWFAGAFSAIDGIYYVEADDTTNGGFRASIGWGDSRGMPSGVPGIYTVDGGTIAQFEIELFGQAGGFPCQIPSVQQGRFAIRWPFVSSAGGFQFGDGFFGHTPGGAALGVPGAVTSTDLLGQVVTTGAGQAAVEEHHNSGFSLSALGTTPTFDLRAYNNFLAVANKEVVFAPNPAPGMFPGALGYTSTPTVMPSDDVDGIIGPAIVTGPGATVTIVGKFFGFGNGNVTFTDGAGITSAPQAGTVISGTGPLFVNEGLVVNVPALAVGTGAINVFFGSGYAESFPVRIVTPCSTVQNMAPPSNGAAVVALAGPASIRHYGQNYGQIFVGEDGIITMNAPNTDFTATLAEFFAGPSLAGNPAVAALWTDLFFTPNYLGFLLPSVTVVEDPCAGTVDVVWENQSYWTSASPAGTFSVRFGAMGPDSIRFDYSGLLNDIGNFDPAVVGISDGSSAVGAVKTNLTTLGGIQTVFPGYMSTAGPESIGESISSSLVASRLRQINGNGIFTIVVNAGLLTVF